MTKLLAGLVAGLVAVGAVLQLSAEEPSELPRRAVIPLIMRDVETPAPVLTPTLPAFPPPPPPGPGYCEPSGLGPPTPPNRIFGHFTIGGELAPAGTLVTLTFDGKPGPSAYSPADGGYRIDYAAGGQGHDPPCINVVGSEMGLSVNGVVVSTGVHVGDPEAYLKLQFDLLLP